MLRFVALVGAVLALGLAPSSPAQATLILTPLGISDGFTLTTFVSGYFFGSSPAYGPLAQGIAPNGDVITGSRGDGKIYVFHDVDGQTLASAVSATSYAFTTFNPNYAMTTAGGQVYGAQIQGNAPFEHFNSDGTHSAIPGLTATDFLGIGGNPVNGHIIAASNQGLIDIDPLAGTYRVINASVFPDGVSVSPDGTTAYVANGGCVQGYSIATGASTGLNACSGRGPDGTGVISGGPFNGDIVVNNNDGTIGLIDPLVGFESIIATGGTRGDFVSPDTSNGTLFISQLEQVARLSCGPGCSIGSPTTPTVPEPASFVLLGSALLGFGLIRRRHRGM